MMARKSNAHDMLSLVFKRDGVPTRIIVDNLKEQSLSEFARKFQEADSHLVNTKPYTP